MRMLAAANTSRRTSRRSLVLTAKTVRLFHLARIAKRVRRAWMPVMQEDRKLRSDRLALRRHRLLEEMVLHLLRQSAPCPNDSLTQGTRKLLHSHAGAGIGGWHPSYSRNRFPGPTMSRGIAFE